MIAWKPHPLPGLTPPQPHGCSACREPCCPSSASAAAAAACCPFCSQRWAPPSLRRAPRTSWRPRQAAGCEVTFADGVCNSQQRCAHASKQANTCNTRSEIFIFPPRASHTGHPDPHLWLWCGTVRCALPTCSVRLHGPAGTWPAEHKLPRPSRCRLYTHHLLASTTPSLPPHLQPTARAPFGCGRPLAWAACWWCPPAPPPSRCVRPADCAPWLAALCQHSPA